MAHQLENMAWSLCEGTLIEREEVLEEEDVRHEVAPRGVVVAMGAEIDGSIDCEEGAMRNCEGGNAMLGADSMLGADFSVVLLLRSGGSLFDQNLQV